MQRLHTSEGPYLRHEQPDCGRSTPPISMWEVTYIEHVGLPWIWGNVAVKTINTNAWIRRLKELGWKLADRRCGGNTLVEDRLSR